MELQTAWRLQPVYMFESDSLQANAVENVAPADCFGLHPVNDSAQGSLINSNHGEHSVIAQSTSHVTVAQEAPFLGTQ